MNSPDDCSDAQRARRAREREAREHEQGQQNAPQTLVRRFPAQFLLQFDHLFVETRHQIPSSSNPVNLPQTTDHTGAACVYFFADNQILDIVGQGVIYLMPDLLHVDFVVRMNMRLGNIKTVMSMKLLPTQIGLPHPPFVI